MTTMKGLMTDLPLDATKPAVQPAVALWEPSPQSQDWRSQASEESKVGSPGVGDDPSLRDPVTGLIGASLFADRLRHTLAGSRRSKRVVLVALLELDRFGITDSDADDSVGDQILRVVASRLTEALRATDTVAQLRGHEFAIIVEKPGDAELICRRLIESIGEPMDIAGVSRWMSASIGGAIGNGDDPQEFLRFATIAQQRSRERGGDTATVLGRV